MKQIDDVAKGMKPSATTHLEIRGEQGRAGEFRGRAGESRGEQGREEESRGEQGRAGGGGEQGRAGEEAERDDSQPRERALERRVVGGVGAGARGFVNDGADGERRREQHDEDVAEEPPLVVEQHALPSEGARDLVGGGSSWEIV